MLKKDTHSHCPRCGDKYQEKVSVKEVMVDYNGFKRYTNMKLCYCTQCGLFYNEEEDFKNGS